MARRSDSHKASQKPSGKETEPPGDGGEADNDAVTPEAAAVPPPIVGIGASAGGLEALRKFVKTIPPDSGVAFVVIQHLDPNHESMMSELLARHCRVEVSEIQDGDPIRPNRVYMLPPNAKVATSNGRLNLSKPDDPRGMRKPIDQFFESLAEAQAERAICIILSGTGNDGSIGLKAVKEHGGFAIVQDPYSAEYDGMPRSALATGLVDLTLPPEEMMAAIARYVDHPYVRQGGLMHGDEAASGALNQILAVLRVQTKQDFRCYKKGTLTRRIDRRMGIMHMNTLADYYEYLRRNPTEVRNLLKDLLIGVTSFFRDPQAWEIVENTIVPGILEDKAPGESVRVWVPGCASGEEAYSVAMAFLDQAQRQHQDIDLQVFGTDIDEEMLDRAREGVYPEGISSDLSPDRLQRYFVREGSNYRISKALRDRVTFAVQNLITDPPFSKLDLISCRNLLIYLEQSIQKKIFPLMQFALNPNGYLFLGSSESVNDTRLFETVSKKWRVYRRVGSPKLALMEFPIGGFDKPRTPMGMALASNGMSRRSIPDTMERELLKSFAPPSVLINPHMQVLYYYGSVRSDFFQVPEGEPTADLISIAQRPLRTKLRACVQKALDKQERVTISGGRLGSGDSVRYISISAKPVSSPDSGPLVLVSFIEEKQEAPRAADGREVHVDETLVQALESELKMTREDLEGTIEELETANEELKASNEEVMSMNEELQSSNEELESSKEELQSLNEELSTVNSQLSDKLEELEETHNDLVNLFASTDIATLFLDTGFRVKRFTPSMTRLLSLVDTDIGRPISDLAPKFADDELLDDAQRVLQDLTRVEKEVEGGDGRYYIRRLFPYRTQDNRIDGVVLTFADVTEIRSAGDQIARARDELEKRVEERTRELEDVNQALRSEISDRKRAEVEVRTVANRLEAVMDTAVDAIITMDGHGAVESFNPAAERIFGYRAADVLGQNVSVLMAEPYRSHHDEYIRRYLRTGESAIIGVGRELQGLHQDGHEFPMELTVSEFRIGKRRHFAALARDITGRKLADQALRASEQRFRDLVEGSLQGVIIHSDWKPVFANQAASHMLGYDKPDELLATESILHHVAPECRDLLQAHGERAMQGDDGSRSLEFRACHADGRELTLEIFSRPINWQGQAVLQSTLMDLTERREAEIREHEHDAELARIARVSTLGELAAMLAHELDYPLTAISAAAGGAPENAAAASSGDMQSALEQIRSQADLATRTITHLRRLLSKTDGKWEEFSVRDAICLALELLRPELDRLKIEADLKVDARSDTVRANQVEVEQVVINLLRNAVEALDGNVEMPRVTVTVEETPDGQLRTTVSDNGKGIAEEQSVNLFQPFQSSKADGMGMGLAISRSIVQRHGGQIWYEPGADAGATFHFTLPRAEG